MVFSICHFLLSETMNRDRHRHSRSRDSYSSHQAREGDYRSYESSSHAYPISSYSHCIAMSRVREVDIGVVMFQIHG